MTTSFENMAWSPAPPDKIVVSPQLSLNDMTRLQNPNSVQWTLMGSRITPAGIFRKIVIFLQRTGLTNFKRYIFFPHLITSTLNLNKLRFAWFLERARLKIWSARTILGMMSLEVPLIFAYFESEHQISHKFVVISQVHYRISPKTKEKYPTGFFVYQSVEDIPVFP